MRHLFRTQFPTTSWRDSKAPVLGENILELKYRKMDFYMQFGKSIGEKRKGSGSTLQAEHAGN